MRFAGVAAAVAAVLAAGVEAKTGKPRWIPSLSLPAVETKFKFTYGEDWCTQNNTQCFDLAYHKTAKAPLVAAAKENNLTVSALSGGKFTSETMVAEFADPVAFKMVPLPSGKVKMVVIDTSSVLTVYSQDSVGGEWTAEGAKIVRSPRFSTAVDGEKVFIAFETEATQGSVVQVVADLSNLDASVRSFDAPKEAGSLLIHSPKSNALVAAFTPDDRSKPVEVHVSTDGNAFQKDAKTFDGQLVEVVALGNFGQDASLTYVREGRLETVVHDGKAVGGKWEYTIRSVNTLNRDSLFARNQVAFMSVANPSSMIMVYPDYAGYSVDFVPNKVENYFNPKKRGSMGDIVSDNGMLLRDVTALASPEIVALEQEEGQWLGVYAPGKKGKDGKKDTGATVTIHRVVVSPYEHEEHDEPARGIKVFIATICILAVVALVLYVYRPKKSKVEGEDMEEQLTSSKEAF